MALATKENRKLSQVEAEAHGLILIRIKEQNQMERLEEVIRMEFARGVSIDALSEASGLRPEAIRKITKS